VESTRFVNYSKDKFGNELTFIKPVFLKNVKFPIGEELDNDQEMYLSWRVEMMNIECTYFHLLKLGATPQEARTVLPNSLKTEIVMSANLREMRHILKLRCSNAAHPQMVQVMRPLLKELQEKIPIIFEDITY